jgi:ribosomal protein L11 methyltransferase
MKYLELTFHITPYNEAAADVLAALLADAGCDTFEPLPSDAQPLSQPLSQPAGLRAFIQESAYSEPAIRAAISNTLALFPITVPEGSPEGFTEGSPEGLRITFTTSPAPDENWNAAWEAEHHFEPISLPDGQLLHIIPRQAFGSGEHATTRLMLTLLSQLSATPESPSPVSAPLAGATVIDAGCGTGILGIAALKLGAARVFAYDIDEWSVRNAQDNFALNGLEATIAPTAPQGALGTPSTAPRSSAFGGSPAEIALGDARCLADAPQASVLLANINRNILLADLPAFAAHLQPGGHLLLSGFYEADIDALLAAAAPLGLRHLATLSDGDWRALHFQIEN